jgi:hypothetical protein
MRIENNTGLSRLQGVRRKPLSGVDPLEGHGRDAVEISARATDLRTAMEALQNAPAVREDRVAELRQQLKDETFDPSVDALVEKLMRGKS